MPLPQVKGLEAIVARGRQPDITPTHLLTKIEAPDPSTIGQQAPCTYAEWLKKTELDWRHPRSSQFKAIDKALKKHEESNYSVATARKLRTAINMWIRYKGVDSWKTSKRNKDHIIELLRVWAFAPGLPTAMSREEIEAYKVLEEARKGTLLRLFTGKRVELKAKPAMKLAGKAAKDVKDASAKFKTAVNAIAGSVPPEVRNAPNLRTGMGAVVQTAGVAKNFVQGDLLNLDSLNLDTLRQAKELIPIETITADFVPFLNIVVGAFGVVKKWGETAIAQRDLVKSRGAAFTIEKGDPQKAFQGLIVCLERNRTKLALEATQASAKFASQTAGTFADLGAATGPIIAAVNAAATLAHKLFLFGRELAEVNEANKVLKDPDNLDFKLFEVYPLAGCYMLRGSSLFEIISMSTVMFGNGGWMDDVELMKKDYIDPLLVHCRKFIDDSVFEFTPDMPGAIHTT